MADSRESGQHHRLPSWFSVHSPNQRIRWSRLSSQWAPKWLYRLSCTQEQKSLWKFETKGKKTLKHFLNKETWLCCYILKTKHDLNGGCQEVEMIQSKKWISQEQRVCWFWDAQGILLFDFLEESRYCLLLMRVF